MTSEPTGRARQILLRLVPIAALVFFLAWIYVSVRSTHAWDDAEPELLTQAWRLAQGSPIYTGIDSPPYTHAVHGPLFPGVVSLALRVTGLNYLPAKAITCLAVLALGLAVLQLSRRWDGETRSGFLAVCLLFLIPAFLYNATRVHPQMLAVALSVWSLAFFIRGRFLDTAVVSPVFAVLALYTKQSQIALPLAMAIYLLLRNRRWFLPYATVGALAGLLPLVWLQYETGGQFLRHVTLLANFTYSTQRFPLLFLEHAGPFLPLLVMALPVLVRRLRENSWEEVDLYLLAAFGVACFTLGGLGAHTQYVVELSVVVILFLLRTGAFSSTKVRDAILTFQILGLLIYTPIFIWQKAQFALASYRAAESILPILRGEPGPIVSEQASLALFSGREPFIKLFDYGDYARQGKWDERKLLSEIEDRRIAWVITEFPIEEPLEEGKHTQRFNPAVVDAVRSHYRRAHVFPPYYLYRPRDPAPARSS